MTYEEAMQFWFGRINYEVKSAKPSDLHLHRMRALLEVLGNPHERLRIVHVAGSKGKGSTSAMLASILSQAGYRTGLFTSPHLVQVEERIQVEHEPISQRELAACLGDIVRAAKEHARIREAAGGTGTYDSAGVHPLDQTLTFFEIATTLGFLHFARRRVDVAVLEVGMGGRFDSTNVCLPLLSIVTSISYDHTQQLGNTLGKIAMEKAGIIKPGRPVLSGVRGDEPRPVIENIARARGAPLWQVDADFQYRHEPAWIGEAAERPARVQVTTRRRAWPWLELGLIGEHQAANAALAVAAVEILREQGLTLPESAVARGLAQVRWPARLEIVGRRPLVLLDCAHNVASAEALAQALTTSFHVSAARGSERKGRRHLIFAGSRDKDLAGMLRVLAPLFDQVHLTQFSGSPRRVPPEQLAALVPAPAVPILHATAADALRAVQAQASPDDLVCITGSVFLAGELRPLLVD